jgi:MFS family permease
MADRLGRRPTMLAAQCSTAATVALLGFMQDPVTIAGVAFCVGMASSASRPAVQAMMADIVRPEDRVRAFSLNYWAINLGFAVSSAAAGFVAQYSYRAGFLGEATMTLLCAVVVFMKVPESKPAVGRADDDAERDGGGGVERSGGDGLQRKGGARRRGAAPAPERVSLGTVLRDRRFMSVVGLSFLVALIFQQGMVGLPVAMGREGFSSSDFGLVMAANGFLIVALQIPATRLIQRRDPRRLLILSSLLAGYGFGLMMFAGSLGTYILMVCVWTLAEIVNAPTQTGLVVRLSPVEGRGRYQGMYAMSWSVAALAAPLMSGTVLDRFGANWLWTACAVFGTAAALGYWLLMRGLQEPHGVQGLQEPRALRGSQGPQGWQAPRAALRAPDAPPLGEAPGPMGGSADETVHGPALGHLPALTGTQAPTEAPALTDAPALTEAPAPGAG